MKEGIVIFSAFDGYSTIMQVCKNLGIPVIRYYASEINPQAIAISKKNHPEIIHLGDIRDIKGSDLMGVTHMFFGSPCQDFSIAGRKKGLVTTEGVTITSLNQYKTLKKEGHKFVGESYLYWETLRIKQEVNGWNYLLGLPQIQYLMENVSMKQEWEDIISKSLGVLPVMINASLVSCQNRKRNFWTNVDGLTIPEDRGIILSDVIPDAVTGVGYRGKFDNILQKYVSNGTNRIDSKSNCLTCSSSGIAKKTGKPYGNGLYLDKSGNVLPYTIQQMEQIQGLSIGYTQGVPKTHRLKMIGNAMSVPVMEHVLTHMFQPMYHNH